MMQSEEKINAVLKKSGTAFLYKKIRSAINKYFLRANFRKEFTVFKKMSEDKGSRLSLEWNDGYPCLYDKSNSTEFEPHYIYHPAWAARCLFKIKPSLHVDIGSYLQFVSIISAFFPTKFYDYRPANLKLSNLSSGYADLTSLNFEDNSISSLSCMHVVEHIGLGRYGDALNPDGDLKAIAELKRILAIGGNLLFVVPVGKPRIAFNAHRIYSYKQILDYFYNFKLKEFAMIPDNYEDIGLVVNATKEMADAQSHGCGCFWFIKM